jgi:hypothetical protein
VYDIIIVIVFIRPMQRADGMYRYGRSSLSVLPSVCMLQYEFAERTSMKVDSDSLQCELCECGYGSG